MSKLDWDRVWRIFDAALDAEPEQRERLLAETCGDDAELRAEIDGLFAGHQHEGVLDRSPAASFESAAPTQTATGAAPSSNASVGPYRILREIGRGGMGVVYLADDARSGRQAALKLIAPHLSAEPQARRRLLAEARAASRLDHPNICEILEVSETDDGRLFLAMPFYEGETLAKRIARGPLPVKEAIGFALQAAAGLERAHAAGVVHRDIKPSNLMIAPDGSLKILDFGVAKTTGAELSDPGVRIGTLAYMAPEQLLGEAVSAVADLWALGVTLYEMTTGRRPFQGEYEPAVMYEIFNEEPAPVRSLNPEAPKGLERLLDALLAKQAGRRLSSAAELKAELRTLERGGVVTAGRGVQQSIPQPLTAFFGRDAEIAVVERTLEAARLATLTGPAGSGKTRLAMEAARSVSADYAGGVWFVSLSQARDRAGALTLIGLSLGLEAVAASKAFDQIEAALCGREALLILDNCEHIADWGLDVVRLLAACPDLRVLATSRSPLRLSGEREIQVDPLDLPDPGASPSDLEQNHAVALFLDRARALQPSFELDDANARHVADLCVRLDGLPLAIELAAARIKLFSPQALVARLGQRLDLLSAKGPDRPERHRTLRRAIEWSHDLLEPAERTLFRRLSAFRGGCDLDAIGRICCGDDEALLLDSLDALLQHNLARRIADWRGDPRLDLLETIRDFGAERLEADDSAMEVRAAHAAYYLEWAETVSADLAGPEQGEALDRFEMELGNLQAALDWAQETRDAESGLRLATAMWRFWLARGRIAEGADRFEALLALPTEELDRTLLAKALHDQATLEQNRGQNVRAEQILSRCIAIWRELGDERGVADALANQAWVDLEISRLDRAEALSKEALAIHTKLGSIRGAAVDWNNLGWASVYRGDLKMALERYRKGLELRKKAGDRRGEGYALGSLAWVEQMRGRFAESHQLLDQATRRLLRIGDRVLLGYTLVVRATALLDEGRLAEATEIAEKAVREWQRGGNRSGEAWTLTVRGEIAVERGELKTAIEVLEQSRQVWSSIGCPWGEASAAAALARAFAAEEQRAEARRALRSSLELRGQVGDERGLAECFEIVAAVEAHASPALALRLAKAAGRMRERLDAPRPQRRLNAAIPEVDSDSDAASSEALDSTEQLVSDARSALG